MSNRTFNKGYEMSETGSSHSRKHSTLRERRHYWTVNSRFPHNERNNEYRILTFSPRWSVSLLCCRCCHVCALFNSDHKRSKSSKPEPLKIVNLYSHDNFCDDLYV